MRITTRFAARCRACGAAIAEGDPCEWNQGQGVKCITCARKKPGSTTPVVPDRTDVVDLVAPDPADDPVALARGWSAVRSITTPADGARPRPVWIDPMRGVVECRPHRGVIYRAGGRCLFCVARYPAFKEATPRKRRQDRTPELFPVGGA